MCKIFFESSGNPHWDGVDSFLTQSSTLVRSAFIRGCVPCLAAVTRNGAERDSDRPRRELVASAESATLNREKTAGPTHTWERQRALAAPTRVSPAPTTE